MPIDFELINSDALFNLRNYVSGWIPGGRFEGVQYVVKNPCRDDKTPGSFKINCSTGIWKDYACNDVSGGDPISLYAYLFTGGQQGEAARAIASQLNIIIDEPKPQKTDTLPQEPKLTKTDTPQWEPIIPIPDDAPEPPTTFKRTKISVYYKYYTAAGELSGYTCRIDYSNGSKNVIPLTYRTNGKESAWKFKSFNIQRPIYGLDQLKIKKNAQVLIVEGEKCKDAAHKIFEQDKNIVVISWIGGCDGVRYINWKPIYKRKIICWPDADLKRYPDNHDKGGELFPINEQPGIVAMLKIHNLIKKNIKDARIITPPLNKKDGWDIADAIDEGWDKNKIIDFIKKNIKPFNGLSIKPETAERKNGLSKPFQCLGYNSYNGNITYYYLPAGTHKVTGLTANSHSKMNLLSLASVQYYEREYIQKNGADYTSAANDCMRECERIGIYDPMRVRGRGAWFDRGRTVLHLGNKLIVNNEEKKIDDFDSYYIYEAEVPTEENEFFMNGILSSEESKKLLEISDLLSWEKKISSKLFAGWIMLAPICGSIEWRPHLWITGESSTGKTWIQDNIISSILGRCVLNASANSTEAGIRQTLKNDAFPVRFDEIETEDKEAFSRVQRILELARQSSSNKAASIIKGTVGGKALSFCIRSCFLFSSINPKIIQQADQNRITMLKLIKRPDYEEGNTFDIIREMVIDTITEEWSQKFRARAISMIPIIRQNIEIFTIIMAKKLKSKRHGDQIGTLLAGAYALKSDNLISIEAAQAWADSVDWIKETEISDTADHEKCLNIIFQQLIPTERGLQKEAIGSLIKKATVVVQGYKDPVTIDNIERDRIEARNALRKYGITPIMSREFQTYEIGIAEEHSLLKKLLIDTPWANGYRHVLARIPGAKIKTAVFADKIRASAISISCEEIFKDSEPADEFEDEEMF